MGDEEDRAQLEEMTEAQREKILYERTERREAMKKRWEIEKVSSNFLFSIFYHIFRKFAKEQNRRGKKLHKIPTLIPMMQIIGWYKLYRYQIYYFF